LTAVTRLEELRALEADWRALAEAQGSGFLTPEWFFAWLEHYGDDAAPLVPVLRDGGTLRGLLPLAVSTAGRPRTCRIAGANIGDRFGPACEPGAEEAVGEAAGEALAEHRELWSVVALEGIDDPAPWARGLREATGMGLTELTRPPVPQPLIDLTRDDGWEGYLQSRSSNFRQQVRRFGRRIERDHSVTVRRTDRSEDLEADLGTFFELHDRRWAGAGCGSGRWSSTARPPPRGTTGGSAGATPTTTPDSIRPARRSAPASCCSRA